MRQTYYKMRQVLQNAPILSPNVNVITKFDVFYKMRRYTVDDTTSKENELNVHVINIWIKQVNSKKLLHLKLLFINILQSHLIWF